jgi:hypothetical protein
MLKTAFAAIAIILATAIIAPTAFVAVAHASCAPGACGGAGAEGAPPPAGQEDGGGHGGSGGNGGDLEPLSPEQRIARLEQTCNAALRGLLPIPEKLVTSFSPQGSVSVIAVCNSGLGHQADIDGSQALPLHDAIATNPAMTTALQHEGFQVEDVVGIIVADGTATLYAHKGPL